MPCGHWMPFDFGHGFLRDVRHAQLLDSFQSGDGVAGVRSDFTQGIHDVVHHFHIGVGQNERVGTYWGGGEKEQLAKRLETYDGISIDYEAARKNFYGLRPHLRSGADLPALRTTEVEIACLRLAATIHEEVTSIRARRVGNRIAYRVVDEVLTPEGYTLEIMPRSSRQPITLGQLISLIDNAKICDPGGGKAKESVESLLRSKPPKLF